MTSRPNGSELLAVARRTLLDQLLPLLPAAKSYDALMVANAMAMAARELDSQGRDESEAQILQFYRRIGLEGTQDATERGLAELIRKRAIDPSQHGLLHPLLLALTRDKLAITNPKQLDRQGDSA
ncbi:acyl-CoA dehydrogenase [Pollutimonas subterranea]|uniref:Acyl-CoA dehydrogenase n=1 Tax=Pollutimonas subterranea TaxID=2045210 RepID=A0A2N4U9A5_9BURK|nr:DUF6285 domain-containing protein [Pollutimonas subterranea]PLC51615.1 acyl-CoA dehydrogenase [Pollutimonas subterranea]